MSIYCHNRLGTPGSTEYDKRVLRIVVQEELFHMTKRTIAALQYKRPPQSLTDGNLES